MKNKDIQHLRKNKYKDKLSENTIKYIQKTAKHSNYLAQIAREDRNDHGCSREEANILSAELNQLGIELSMIRSAFDLTIMYKVATLFRHQISRFQHKKSKYHWNNSMREKMLNVLNDCLAKL